MRVEELFTWIKERHAIWVRKSAGQVKPWTDDPILQTYRFCNVYRELDKETIAIRKLWREPYANHQDLWFAMVVARLVNWSPTLEELRYPAMRWNPGRFVRVMKGGGKRWGGAYIVSTNGMPGDKAQYIADKVLTPLWVARAEVRPAHNDSLQAFFERLLHFNGMGTFIAAQVVADMKYATVLNYASDWHTFAASGPGSRRGMNRVLGLPKDQPWKEVAWHQKLMELKAAIDTLVQEARMPPIHAQDLQNCLCEFDKYERVRLGEGRPRALYDGN